MSRTKIAIVAAVTLVAGAGFLGARAHGPRHADPERIQAMVSRHLDRVLDKLDATEEQREQITAIRARVFAEVLPVMQQHRVDKQAAVATLLGEGEVDAEALRAKLDGHLDAHRKLASTVLDAVLEVREVLTAEQRAQIREHLEERMCGHCPFGE